MKKFGTIKDGRTKDIFSIIIFGFPIICYRSYNFTSYKKCFANEEEFEDIKFLWLFGFHIFTSNK